MTSCRRHGAKHLPIPLHPDGWGGWLRSHKGKKKMATKTKENRYIAVASPQYMPPLERIGRGVMDSIFSFPLGITRARKA